MPQPVGAAGLPPSKAVVEKSGVRVLCIADVRGHLRTLNELAKKANADYILHTGDFGFYDDSSLERIADKTLRHVAQYSPLLEDAMKKRIQNPGPTNIKQLVAQETHPLSELPLFLNKTYTLDVPVYTVWGACEDVRVLEKFRSGEYKIANLHIIDEASSRLLDVGGVKLRILGLGGAVVMHKLFDNGEGRTTIAGGQGTMWTTLLQMGELVDTANRVYDPTETRIFLTHNSPAREGLLNQLSVTLKADFSISAGLHFRYGSSYNEFSVNPSLDHYRGKLASSKASFNDVWETVKGEVNPAVSQNTSQQSLLENALAFVDKMPTNANGGNPFGGPSANAAPGAGQVDESAFKNMWNFNLADAAFGWLVLEVENGRIGTEMKAQGFNFSHRGGKNVLGGHQPAQPAQQPTVNMGNAPAGPSSQTVSTPTPISPAVPQGPAGSRNKPAAKAATPPIEPKAASPQVRHIEPAVPKSVTPRPTAPTNRTETPVSAAEASSPEITKATPSNGAAGQDARGPSPAVDSPAQEHSSRDSRAKQHGLYIAGISTEEEVRRLIPEEHHKDITQIQQKFSKQTKNPFFLVHMETDEVTKETLDKLPADIKVHSALREGKPYVKVMAEDSAFNHERRNDGSRAGMEGSRWGRGQGIGGNTSESDNQSGSAFRTRGGRGGNKFRGDGGAYPRGSHQGRGGAGRGGRRGQGAPNAPTAE
ncbi:hypothetical protein EDC01DRAFT_758522 [Geopyxis carbonaria]|nr:hypothetical protein EDC01DRAFT_758522 [Geopyxis carbonaria]